MEDIKILHLKSNAQKLETWVAMLNGEKKLNSLMLGFITTIEERESTECCGTQGGNMFKKIIKGGLPLPGVNHHHYHYY